MAPPQLMHHKPAERSLTSGKFHLLTALVVPFLLQIIATSGLVGFIIYRSGQRAVNTVANQLRMELTNRINEKLASYAEVPHTINRLNASAVTQGYIDIVKVKGEYRFWQQMQIYPELSYSYCGHEAGAFMGVGLFSEQNRSQMQLRFSNPSTKFIRQNFSLDDQGNRTAKVGTFPKPYDPRVRPWYKAAKAAKKAGWSEIYLDFTTLLPTVTASIPIYSKTDRSLIGVCATDLNLPQQLSEFLQTLKIGKTGTAFIVERSGLLVATSAKEPMIEGQGENTKRLPASRSANPAIRVTAQYLARHLQTRDRLQSVQQLDFILHGKRQYIQVVPFRNRNIDWLIVLTIPESDFMAEIDAGQRNALWLSLAALGVAMIIGVRTAHWITRPLLRISQASAAVAKGNLEQRVGTSSIREIAALSQSFNSMASQLQDDITKLQQAEEALRLSNEALEDRVEQRTAELRQEKERSEQLLLNVLPASIAERLKKSNEFPAEHFEEVTILFADIVGFTGLSARLEPMELVARLNQIFSAFDQLTETYNLEKIKTIGDAYMVVGGLPIARADHATAIANIALDMQAYMQTLDSVLGESLELRVGINTGPVIAGVIGIKKFTYDLWGDAVNVASRMESHGQPGYIQVTDTTYLQLKDHYILEPRGNILIKGRGEMMTYWLIGKRV